ncbi:MAG: tryptophan-rich sensory protein, partial [Firmicutes bacterium]|nr:tryptophan-rich sensory protein [Bacillota bacterium]
MVWRCKYLKIQWKELLVCIAIPLLVGAISAFLTKNNMAMFGMINKPPLSPPAWLFPVVWTILYILMGIASYLVYTSEKSVRVTTALKVYGLQLIFNFLW